MVKQWIFAACIGAVPETKVEKMTISYTVAGLTDTLSTEHEKVNQLFFSNTQTQHSQFLPIPTF